MSGVTGAVVGATVVGAAGSMISANKAAGAADKGARRAVDAQQQQYQQTRADEAPWRTTGGSALNSIAQLYGLDYQDASGKTVKGSGKPNFSAFTSSPDYQFAQQQGQQAIDRSAAARGGLLSGGAVREGERYASGLASQQFGNYFNRLAGVAGAGQQSNQVTANSGMNAANQIGGAYQNAGNARASAYMDMGQTLGNSVNGLAGNYLLQKYYNGGVTTQPVMANPFGRS